jgi:hypothetical protein
VLAIESRGEGRKQTRRVFALAAAHGGGGGICSSVLVFLGNKAIAKQGI